MEGRDRVAWDTRLGQVSGDQGQEANGFQGRVHRERDELGFEDVFHVGTQCLRLTLSSSQPCLNHKTETFNQCSIIFSKGAFHAVRSMLTLF